VLAMIVKEFRQVVRDRRTLAMLIVMPVVLLLVFGYAASFDVDEIPTLVYDADRSPQSRELISRLDGSRFFQIVGYVEDDAEFERAIDRNEALLAMWIPRGFAADLARRRPATVQVVVDGSDSNTASIALG